MNRRLSTATSSAVLSLVFAAGTLGFAGQAHAQDATAVPVPVAEPVVPTQSDPSAVAEAAVSKSTTDPATKLAEIKARGASAIATRQATLSSLTSKLSQATTDCGSNAQMLNEISATSSGLGTVGTSLAASNDVANAKTLGRLVYTDYRVYLVVAPKAGKILRCNTHLTRNAALTSEGAKLQASIDAAAARGANVGSAQAAKDSAMASLALINPPTALTGVLGLVPDKGDKTVQAANAAAMKQADALLDSTVAQQKAVNQKFNDARKLLSEANKADRAADRTAAKTARQTSRQANRTTTVPAVAPTVAPTVAPVVAPVVTPAPAA
jgi:hypothetical protein